MLESLLFGAEDTTSLGILLSMFLGLRIGEVCGLRWGDIDFESQTVKIARTVERIADTSPTAQHRTKVIISEPKTEKSIRTIPLPVFLTEYIQKQRKANSVYLLSENHHFIEPHCFYLRYKKFLRRNHIPDYTFHALRHTFATRCVEAGFDIKSLAEILGHASVTTTMMFYVHPSMETKRSQMELLSPK